MREAKNENGSPFEASELIIPPRNKEIKIAPA